MKVSIITVCFNSDRTIEDTIKSVQSQTYDDIEYIVIDGGSTDRTEEIVGKYGNDVSVFISEKDEGLYDAMNKGISLATGDVVGMLNSDDVFASASSVETLMQGFLDKDVEAVYADLVYVSENNLNKVTRVYSSKVFKLALIKFGIMLPHPTFYVKKEMYEKYGLYKLSYRVAADFELIARFFSCGIIAKRLSFVAVKMREGGISSRGILWRIHQNFEIVRACRENGVSTSIFLVMLKLPYKLSTMMASRFAKACK